jgi:hypothetical protein
MPRSIHAYHPGPRSDTGRGAVGEGHGICRICVGAHQRSEAGAHRPWAQRRSESVVGVQPPHNEQHCGDGGHRKGVRQQSSQLLLTSSEAQRIHSASVMRCTSPEQEHPIASRNPGMVHYRQEGIAGLEDRADHCLQRLQQRRAPGLGFRSWQANCRIGVMSGVGCRRT